MGHRDAQHGGLPGSLCGMQLRAAGQGRGLLQYEHRNPQGGVSSQPRGQWRRPATDHAGGYAFFPRPALKLQPKHHPRRRVGAAAAAAHPGLLHLLRPRATRPHLRRLPRQLSLRGQRRGRRVGGGPAHGAGALELAGARRTSAPPAGSVRQTRAQRCRPLRLGVGVLSQPAQAAGPPAQALPLHAALGLAQRAGRGRQRGICRGSGHGWYGLGWTGARGAGRIGFGDGSWGQRPREGGVSHDGSGGRGRGAQGARREGHA
mmetsp:Transcript_20113/g.44979  ORF Transcript_20113/g.44979 Transcript_20113/m.44979 type:complete len:261 (-) Transcript_20113:557-1339(-)